MSGDVGVLFVRALAGGAIVSAFALIGEVVTPKAFSGLFSAAPSVAVAGLAITVMSQSSHSARQGCVGMVIGALGMVACCILAAASIPRLHAIWGSATAWLGWAVVALGVYWAVFIGAR